MTLLALLLLPWRPTPWMNPFLFRMLALTATRCSRFQHLSLFLHSLHPAYHLFRLVSLFLLDLCLLPPPSRPPLLLIASSSPPSSSAPPLSFSSSSSSSSATSSSSVPSSLSSSSSASSFRNTRQVLGCFESAGSGCLTEGVVIARGFLASSGRPVTKVCLSVIAHASFSLSHPIPISSLSLSSSLPFVLFLRSLPCHFHLADHIRFS